MPEVSPIKAHSIVRKHLSTDLINAIYNGNKNTYKTVIPPNAPDDYIYAGQTTDGTQTEIYLNGSTGQRLQLRANSMYSLTIKVLAHNITDSHGYISDLTQGFKTNSSSAATFIDNRLIKVITSEGNMSSIDIDLSETSGELYINVTGLAAKTINWKLKLNIEVI